MIQFIEASLAFFERHTAVQRWFQHLCFAISLCLVVSVLPLFLVSSQLNLSRLVIPSIIAGATTIIAFLRYWTLEPHGSSSLPLVSDRSLKWIWIPTFSAAFCLHVVFLACLDGLGHKVFADLSILTSFLEITVAFAPSGRSHGTGDFSDDSSSWFLRQSMFGCRGKRCPPS